MEVFPVLKGKPSACGNSLPDHKMKWHTGCTYSAGGVESHKESVARAERQFGSLRSSVLPSMSYAGTHVPPLLSRVDSVI
jgi:hypothetical protein